MDISKRTVVITGALRGLGYQLSKCLIRDNKMKIILTSRDASSAQKIVDELKSLNKSCTVDYHQLQIDSKQSITEFVNWIQQTHQTIDVLVNNAATADKLIKDKSLGDLAQEVLYVNFTCTVNLTLDLLPILSQDGKVVMVSSLLGSLKLQGSAIQKELSDPQITLQDLNEKIRELIQMRRSGKLVGWQDQSWVIYSASKCLLNAYSRFVLTKTLPSDKQTVIVLEPGWCQTEMGGMEAPFKPEEGTRSMLKAIWAIPFGQPEKYSGIFLNDSGEQRDY